jgi:flagellar biosynthesis GTPase FlhF
MDTTADTKTYRGRSLDDVLPQVRAELGPDAIVIRRREGLAGGVAGFFQRSYVEVEARPSLPDETALELRSDRATAEGLATPGMQALVQQAAPFSDALASAADGVLQAAAREMSQAPAAPAAPAGLYGPQPAYQPAQLPPVAAAAAEALLEPAPEAPAPTVPARAAEPPAPTVPARTAEPPAAAAGHEAKLVAAGISAALAADLVGEAVAHGLPFAGTRQLKKLVRATLARRVPVLSDIGPGARRIAFVGAGGAGKSAAIAGLARAYAQADAEVVVVALRSADGGCDLAAELEPHGVSVIAAADAAQAERRLARRDALVTLVDTPAAGVGGPGSRAGVAALAADLQALGVDEIHLTLPATLSAAAADELAGALSPLGITNVALTHADQTTRPGAPVELAMTARKPLSYVCGRDSIELADASDIAQRLLP